MDLREYLFRKDMSITEFAKRVDMSRAYVSSIVNGRAIPSKKLAKRIVITTEGFVTLDELRNPFIVQKGCFGVKIS